MGKVVRDALGEMPDLRPFFDSEHGPIHAYKDKHITLPETFDDEYFRHMQWAHLASGAAGGGMRWPNRDPHVLTGGMREAQLALSAFLPLIDWPRFRRRNLHGQVMVEGGGVFCFACGDAAQAVLWLLRTDCIAENGLVYRDGKPAQVRLAIPGLERGHYRITSWDTRLGIAVDISKRDHDGGMLSFEPPVIAADLAIALRRIGYGVSANRS
jgi:hypothetical protein